MSRDDLSPLCPCGGICTEQRKPTIPYTLAICLRCGKILGAWGRIMEAVWNERKVEEQQEEFRAKASSGA